MSNNTVYILNKDTPTEKAGVEYVWHSGMEGCVVTQPNGMIGQGKIYTKETVENNPEWFSIKKEDKVKVTFFTEQVGLGVDDLSYKFKVSAKSIPPEKYDAIRKAIEFIINKNGVVNEYQSFESKIKGYIETGGFTVASIYNEGNPMLTAIHKNPICSNQYGYEFAFNCDMSEIFSVKHQEIINAINLIINKK